ncbi:putative aryl-alcohol dehydrogenase [Glarea lozoyensis 74030]|uniref:Putative aryl-alcohol dehydrogenase n=1 Tax=Glarea lozoyensis (strain ATCC 74030 / MF5533) TaxID=1104152 RepID=H0EE37_GLAL7|nr:putative aryl-alcohol dehydrogenase [Glarea lozoyensis 74030]
MPKSLAASVEGSKAEYVRLGKSGLKISVPVFGTMSIGDPGWIDWVEGEEKSLPLLKAAYDMGLNTWDTANVYSNGASEILVGKAIKKYNIPRNKVVVLTKCFGAVGEEMGVRSVMFPKEIKASKDYVNNHDASLKRLELDYIDLLQIHRFDPDTPHEETMEALHDLIKSGKWAPLFRGHLARPLSNLGKTTRSAPEADKGLTEADEGIVKRVQELADKKGWKMSHVALAWINKRVSSPIIGFSSVERIQEALDARGKTLTDEEEKYLEELYAPKNIIGHS